MWYKYDFLITMNYLIWLRVAKKLHYRVATCAKNIQKREYTEPLLRNILMR